MAFVVGFATMAAAPASMQQQLKRDSSAINLSSYYEQGQFNFRKSGGYHAIRRRRRSGGWLPKIKYKHFNKKRHGKALRRKHRRAAA